ncbi:MAG: amidohydrolase family protein [Planctomycetota bacterium]
MRPSKLFISLLVAATACRAPDVTAFVDVDVLDVRRGTVVAGRTVLVRGARIVAVGAAEEVRVPPGATRHLGGVLIPGLWDLHLHDVEDPVVLRACLSAGVTTVRGMGGDPDATLAMRAAVAAGEVDGPRLFVPGPFLGGPEWAPWHVVLPSAADAAAEVYRLHDAGVDFLKVHDQMSAEAYAALAETAREVGLSWAGHVPRGLDPLDVVRRGQSSLEHASILAEHGLTGRALESDEGFAEWCDAWVRDTGTALAAEMKARGAALVPTLVASEALTRAMDPSGDAWSDPRLDDVPAATLDEWRALLPAEGLPEDFLQERRCVDRAARFLTGFLAERDVAVLVGTDGGAPLTPHGASIHDELALLEECGLDRATILRAATLGAADLLGQADVGAVEVGFVADLVLVAGDPLTELAVLREPRVVLRAGAVVVPR